MRAIGHKALASAMICMFAGSASAGTFWRTTAGMDINGDNNIADNITHVSDTWGVPYASLFLRQSWKGSREWSLQADYCYENELDSRSPTLNSPLDQYTLRMIQGMGKDVALAFFGKAARTYDGEWQLVKLLGRAGTKVEWSPSAWKLEFDIHHDWENYGDHAQDGNTRWYMLDLRYDLWKGIQLGWGYVMEDRQAYSSAYTYVDQGLEANLRIPIGGSANLGMQYSRSYKIYSTSKRNQEWQAAMRLTVPFGNMKARAGFTGKRVHSNQPGYSWSEQTSTTTLEWSMDNKKATPKKRSRK